MLAATTVVPRSWRVHLPPMIGAALLYPIGMLLAIGKYELRRRIHVLTTGLPRGIHDVSCRVTLRIGTN